eukprot:CAMPEP_0170467300 /NCGR_PEP_ID=MMETSP0123-20130129/10927_1 /TAXON_ID=182087 /ORGANISM="Favella ehrenbergii, Strain Fehren 1" /LENGTH=371 /DNA_ID=CAMNT_0010733625 /DNA_START=74 /DNA_END=1189 /DNA_ORIENTATION=+
MLSPKKQNASAQLAAQEDGPRQGREIPQAAPQTDDIPVIDLNAYLSTAADGSPSETALAECNKVAECFHRYGIILIRDPRVNMSDNDTYIDLMEEYFADVGDRFYANETISDIKPEFHYQVGATPEFIEKARNHSEKLSALNLAPEDTPESPLEPVLDAKWRFMWKIGERPDGASDDFPAVKPERYPDWEDKMNTWGGKLHSAIFTVAEMAAIGMGVEKSAFTSRMEGGAHLLAPTGSDLVKNDIGAIFAGFHYDISFMTIHGKSRYPGLFVWTRDWKKKAVKIPEGCLLIQSGTSFEHITGGYVLSGFHEVVYTEATKEAVKRRAQQFEALGINRRQWRVSSTMFTHFRNDVDIGPMAELSHLYTPDQAA